MADTPKNPLRDGDAQATTGKSLPHGRAASAQAPGTETDKAVRQANDYSLTGEEATHDEVTNPNLHYGSRILEDPDLEAGVRTPQDGPAPSNDQTPLDAGDRSNGSSAGTDTPAPADSDLSGAGPSANGAGPADSGPKGSRTAGGATNSIAGDRPDGSPGAPTSSDGLGSLASAGGAVGGPVGSGGGPGGGPGGGSPTPPDLGPTDIVVGGGSVDENSIQGTTVAVLGTVDPEPGDTFTYAITNDPSGFFQVVGGEIQVAPGANIDYEADQSHDITVEVTDGNGNTYAEVITLTVNNLWDEGPTDILLGGGMVDENACRGHNRRHVEHSRCRCRRQFHLYPHQRPFRLLRDRRQRSSRRSRRDHRLRDRSEPRYYDRGDRQRRQHLFGSRHDHGQRPDRREPDRHRCDRRVGRRRRRPGHHCRHAVDGRRRCRRQPYLCDHQRPLRLLRDRRQ